MHRTFSTPKGLRVRLEGQNLKWKVPSERVWLAKHTGRFEASVWFMHQKTGCMLDLAPTLGALLDKLDEAGDLPESCVVYRPPTTPTPAEVLEQSRELGTLALDVDWEDCPEPEPRREIKSATVRATLEALGC